MGMDEKGENYVKPPLSITMGMQKEVEINEHQENQISDFLLVSPWKVNPERSVKLRTGFIRSMGFLY